MPAALSAGRGRVGWEHKSGWEVATALRRLQPRLRPGRLCTRLANHATAVPLVWAARKKPPAARAPRRNWLWAQKHVVTGHDALTHLSAKGSFSSRVSQRPPP